ncbi:hypothetical protein D3C81_1678840 [compost metagenome]
MLQHPVAFVVEQVHFAVHGEKAVHDPLDQHDFPVQLPDRFASKCTGQSFIRCFQASKLRRSFRRGQPIAERHFSLHPIRLTQQLAQRA